MSREITSPAAVRDPDQRARFDWRTEGEERQACALPRGDRMVVWLEPEPDAGPMALFKAELVAAVGEDADTTIYTTSPDAGRGVLERLAAPLLFDDRIDQAVVSMTEIAAQTRRSAAERRQAAVEAAGVLRGDLPPPPEDVILRELRERGWGVAELARRMWFDAAGPSCFAFVAEVIAGTVAIGEELAARLASALHGPAEYWLEADKRYWSSRGPRRTLAAAELEALWEAEPAGVSNGEVV